METETGMKVLYQALASKQAQIVVFHGDVERIKQRVLRRSPEPSLEAVPELLTTDPDHEDEQPRRDSASLLSGNEHPTLAPQPLHVPTSTLGEALKHMVSSLLKVRVEEIDVETEFSEYGFDSVAFTAFAHRLNQTYQLDLTPALFYEHSTIERLTQYLETAYAIVLAPSFVGTSVGTIVLSIASC
jgi:acyl carrier protein